MDFYESTTQLKKIAESGDKNAERELGKCYLSGKGVEKNVAKALELLNLASQKGDCEADKELGIYYLTQSTEVGKAIEYFSKAAEMGDVSSQVYLGVCYFDGKGVERDLKKAEEYLSLAAKTGDYFAVKFLKEIKKIG